MLPKSAHYELLADLTVVAHVAFILFVVAGQALIVLGWIGKWTWTRNPAVRLSHLAAIGLVVFEAWIGLSCPLTVLENHLRGLAGRGAYEMSFIGYWLDRLVFYSAPAWVFTLVYSLFGLSVLATFIGYPPRLRRLDHR